MRLLTHFLIKRHFTDCPYTLPALRRSTSSFSDTAYPEYSFPCIDRTFGIPVGRSGHVLLSVTESSAFPKEAYPNVIVYLPPGPIFQQPNGENKDVTNPREKDELIAHSSLTHNGFYHFRTQHHLASATSSTVVTIHYRLGTLESIEEEEEEEQEPEKEGAIIDSMSQSEKGPRLHRYKYPTPIHDTLVAFDWIQETFQPTQTSVLGTHIGGSIALMLALTEAQTVHAVAALEPICDWTGLDAYCTVPEEDQTEELESDAKPDAEPSSGTSTKGKGKRKKPQSPAPPDLAPLLQARESFFQKPEQYFDTFASPLLFLRSPGKAVPVTVPKYLTGPDYPIPVLKPHVVSDDESIDLWDAIEMPTDEDWIDYGGVVHSPSSASDSNRDDGDGSNSTTTPPTTITTTTEMYTPRYRKALSRWPPFGLDWGLSGTTWSHPYQRLKRLQMTLPWVRIFVRHDNTTIDDNNPDPSTETIEPQESQSPTPKSSRRMKKPKNEGTVLSQQADTMVDVMRRACFWGRERGFSERGVVLERVPGEGDGHGHGDEMWRVSAEEEAGRWLFEVRGEAR